MSNLKIDEAAYALDKIFKHLDAMIPELATAVTEGIVSPVVASQALKKLRQSRERLLEAVPNQDRLQLSYALDELRAERNK
jgi:hypothetical protein